MAYLPSLRQLQYLSALADHLNFTQAAQACFVGQSTLSAGLKELETMLGVQLVERDRQNVALTDIGHEVLARARQLLTQAADLVACAAQPMSGNLRLGVIPTIAPFVLPQMMPLLRQRFPDLKVSLREDLTAHLIERLMRHDIDIALIALPYDLPAVRSRVLYADEFWLVANDGDPALKGRTITATRGWTDRLLLLEEGHCLREHSLRACGRAEVASSDGLEATSLLTLLQMVESGLGLALLPEMAIKSGILKHSSLVGRPLAAPAPRRQVALVTRNSFARIEVFDAISDLLVETGPQGKQGHALRAKRRGAQS
jgi:LysR family hydrogen peroxide-inducible transcriptional activator